MSIGRNAVSRVPVRATLPSWWSNDSSANDLKATNEDKDPEIHSLSSRESAVFRLAETVEDPLGVVILCWTDGTPYKAVGLSEFGA